METADHEVLRTACDWLDAGEKTYLVTVAKTFGSSPRRPGSLLVLSASGRFAGSVSGGCIEYDLTARLRENRMPEKLPGILTYGVTREEAQRFGLPCGGRLELAIESLDNAAPLRRILSTIEACGLILRRVRLDTGEVSLHTADTEVEFFYDGHSLKKVFGPRWRLLLIGAGQISRFVAQMGLALDYEVIVCDPRREIAEQWRVPGTALDTRMPDDAVRELAHRHCAVLALMHDPKLDDLALLEALTIPAFYIGALGSQANNDRRRARLASFGVSRASLARLHGPIGLPIGSKTPAEIAVAVLAGITAVRRGVANEARAHAETASVKAHG